MEIYNPLKHMYAFIEGYLFKWNIGTPFNAPP